MRDLREPMMASRLRVSQMPCTHFQATIQEEFGDLRTTWCLSKRGGQSLSAWDCSENYCPRCLRCDRQCECLPEPVVVQSKPDDNQSTLTRRALSSSGSSRQAEKSASRSVTSISSQSIS